MSLMLIKDPDPKIRKVDDLDFTFIDGFLMSLTIDKELGDSMEYPTPDTIVIHLSEKLSTDGLSTLPAEDVTVYVKNIITIRHRTREITDRTLAQELEFQKTLQEMATSTIQ